MADELTQDELTLLLIAAEGQSMMPLGRWEKPVESLIQKGLLRQIDRFNNVISPKGREVLAENEKQNDAALQAAFNAEPEKIKKFIGLKEPSKLYQSVRTQTPHVIDVGIDDEGNFCLWIQGQPDRIVIRKDSPCRIEVGSPALTPVQLNIYRL